MLKKKDDLLKEKDDLLKEKDDFLKEKDTAMKVMQENINSLQDENAGLKKLHGNLVTAIDSANEYCEDIIMKAS